MALSKIDTGGLEADSVDNTILDLASDFAGIHIGGTGSSNVLNDYEEGTWVPSLVVTNGSWTLGTQSNASGHYVKVGDIVHYWFDITVGACSGSISNVGVNGIPFAAESISSHNISGYGREMQATGHMIYCEGFASTPRINVLRNYANGTVCATSTRRFTCSGMYKAA